MAQKEMMFLARYIYAGLVAYYGNQTCFVNQIDGSTTPSADDSDVADLGWGWQVSLYTNYFFDLLEGNNIHLYVNNRKPPCIAKKIKKNLHE